MVEGERSEHDERLDKVVNVARTYVAGQVEKSKLDPLIVITTLRHWSTVYCGSILDYDTWKEKYFKLDQISDFKGFISSGFFIDVGKALGHYSFPGTDPVQKQEMARYVPKAFARLAEEI